MVATVEQAVKKIMHLLPPKAVAMGKITNTQLRTFITDVAGGADRVMARDTQILRSDLGNYFHGISLTPTTQAGSSSSFNHQRPLPTTRTNVAVVGGAGTRDPYDDDFVNDADGGNGVSATAAADTMIEVEFDSDDEEFFDESNADVRRIFQFLQDATYKELLAIDGISVKKADIIVANRPFESWHACNEFFEEKFPRMAVSDMANSIKNFLNSRTIVWKVIRQCRTWGARMERAMREIDNGTNGSSSSSSSSGAVMPQPPQMSTSMHMKHYQLKGLTWMVKLRQNGINGILADEMGLGKTVQAIAFIVHELELQRKSATEVPNQYPFLIVVPSSTIDNWLDEFRQWAPHVRIVRYHGMWRGLYGVWCERRRWNYQHRFLTKKKYTF